MYRDAATSTITLLRSCSQRGGGKGELDLTRLRLSGERHGPTEHAQSHEIRNFLAAVLPTTVSWEIPFSTMGIGTYMYHVKF
jgi:hypothetical protein